MPAIGSTSGKSSSPPLRRALVPLSASASAPLPLYASLSSLGKAYAPAALLVLALWPVDATLALCRSALKRGGSAGRNRYAEADLEGMSDEDGTLGSDTALRPIAI